MVKIYVKTTCCFGEILNIAHFWYIYEGFSVMFSAELEAGSPFCAQLKPFRHWVSGSNLNSQCQSFYSYLIFFSRIFRRDRLGHSLGQEKHQICIFRGLTAPILIKIDRLLHFGMLHMMMEKKIGSLPGSWNTLFRFFGNSNCNNNKTL